MTTDNSGLPGLAPRPGEDGTLFRVRSPGARTIELQLYESATSDGAARTVAADRDEHDVWSVFVSGVTHGQSYTWSRDGGPPLLDPFAVAVSGPTKFGCDDPTRLALPRPTGPAVNSDARKKSLVVREPEPVTWQRPAHRRENLVIYELHVRGFTRGSGANVEFPGTYRGLAEKIPYLLHLGINAVELLPVFEFDEMEPRPGIAAPTDLVNYWGYNPLSWFAPMRRFAADAERPEGPIDEFRAMVAAFHAAGIEVIVDVVFNHTAEGDANGPTWHHRALDDRNTYVHDKKGRYVDHSGCGNTVRCARSATCETILESLHWWHVQLGIDGFRFDLAAILARDDAGAETDAPPLIRAMDNDPALREARLIAEPWDAGGSYRVGRWPGGARWAEWNDRFRDDVRRAWLLGETRPGVLARRLTGSHDLFADAGAGPPRSLNFVTAHDGFTLSDSVSFDKRHNDANGEAGRDGHAHEVSANHGSEGPTDDDAVIKRRDIARRNLVATLLLAHGTPMMLMGDESGRTQRGNNNAYCHDGPLTWMDWTEADKEFHGFVRDLLRARRNHSELRRREFLTDRETTWLSADGESPPWNGEAAAFAYRIGGILLAVNPLDQDVEFPLPGDAAWKLVLSTATDQHAPTTTGITLSTSSLTLLHDATGCAATR
ncbi:MAG: alpha-amylase family glycosyl hydrolase [Planctomycetota bacterium]